MSLAAFLVAFPEFVKAGDAMVTAALAQAELEVSDTFGPQRDQAVMLRLADTLALSPWGRDARLTTAAASTSPYGQRFARLADANAVSASRMGSPLGLSLSDYDG